MTQLVARGRAGRGCSNCHKRRIRCDFVRPGCSQCARARKVCPGYPDPNAIIIRNQSEEVIRKLSAREKSRNDLASPFQIFMLDERSPTNMFKPASASPTPSTSSTPVDVDGIGFFFATYAVDHIVCTPGKEWFSTSPLWNRACGSKALYAALNALGLAGLSNVTNSSETMAIARSVYSTALRNTMVEIDKGEEAQTYTTLLAVMFLSLFEIVTSSEFDPSNWGDHMDGAIALLQIQTVQQFVDEGGIKMLLEIYFTVAIHCLQKDIPLPRGIEQSAKDYRESQLVNIPKLNLAIIAFQFVGLNHSTKRNASSDPIDIIGKARAIETELQEWRSALTPEWEYSTIEAREPHERIFQGRYHTYNIPWVSRAWNHYRWVRILVHELILDHLDKISNISDIDILQQRKTSLAVIAEMATEIFTSAPAQDLPELMKKATDPPRPRISGAFILLWPLAVAAKSTGASNEAIDWATSLMDDIGHSMGINKALAIADSVRLKQKASA